MSDKVVQMADLESSDGRNNAQSLNFVEKGTQRII